MHTNQNHIVYNKLCIENIKKNIIKQNKVFYSNGYKTNIFMDSDRHLLCNNSPRQASSNILHGFLDNVFRTMPNKGQKTQMREA